VRSRMPLAVGLQLLLAAWAALAASGATPPCSTTLPPAPVAVPGFATSMAGCIGAQGSDATRRLAWNVDCSGAGLNLTAATVSLAAVCAETPGCAAFSIDSPAYNVPKRTGKLMCEIHPVTIGQGSEPNHWWNVWQKSAAPKAGQWPYPKGECKNRLCSRRSALY
jgi:hypothetical protein